MADVVTMIHDMLFASKVRETAKQLGLALQAARDPDALAAAARGARLVIVDLRLAGAIEALGRLAGDPETAAVPIVGFIDHERLDVMDAARAKGCSTVLARGAFAARLPSLLGELVVGSGPQGQKLA